MKAVMILGAGLMQEPAMRAARALGYHTVLADGNPEAVLSRSADSFFNVDLKDIEGLIKVASTIEGLSGVLTAGTDFSYSVARVADALGLPGIPPAVALAASDKYLMRQTLHAAGIPVPVFASGCTSDDPIQKMEELAALKAPENPEKIWPLVVKPVDNMGGRGCRLVEDKSGLVQAWQDAAAHSRTGRVIIEDYIDGPEFSIDSLVYEGQLTVRGIADRHIFFEPYFIEMGHTIPSAYDPTILAELTDVFTKAVRALGITNGAAKGDVKYSKKGPVIGEIAARLSGGYMSGWTYPYSSGVDPAEDAVRIACGLAPSLPVEEKSNICAERAFISIPGTVADIVGLESARQMPGVQDIFSRIEVGTSVVFPRNNVEKCGNVIAVAPDYRLAALRAETASRSILVRLQPQNLATDAFLRQGLESTGPTGDWPPAAYEGISAIMQGVVAALPDYFSLQKPFRSIAIKPLIGLEREKATDWVGRSLQDSLDIVHAMTGVQVAPHADILLGKLFWQALFRGGYQAAVYIVDCLKQEHGLA